MLFSLTVARLKPFGSHSSRKINMVLRKKYRFRGNFDSRGRLIKRDAKKLKKEYYKHYPEEKYRKDFIKIDKKEFNKICKSFQKSIERYPN